MIYLDLFLGFLKVGCFTFGGGYGAVPLIRDVVLGKGWLSDEMLTYMIAVSESTPGPIMVNMATYIGSSQGGILGAAVATAAVVLPSFCIILLIATLLGTILKNKYAQAILRGLKPCVIGIVIATGIRMTLEGASADMRTVVLTLVLAGIMVLYKGIFKKKIPPTWFILLSAVAGILAYLYQAGPKCPAFNFVYKRETCQFFIFRLY